ncbi:hypothetical protein BGW38_005215 [Lunasporangiospora selenospora]|uniref:LIM zinc-binding domain-containing protein n=1 Tax=Lunasporangiospora selenospora TaxID=979761 RepID=A0A9P6FZP0_9FUNG|nr:hypothetical protein BGW38_005215 [Lunasporangiospora selenospora]
MNRIQPLQPPQPLQPLVPQKQCHTCSKSILQAKVYVEPGKPSIIYCEKCYVEKFTKGNCPMCYKPVMSKTDPYITHNKRAWHSACFHCFKCQLDLSMKPMVDLRGRPCCEDCLMAQEGATQSPPPLDQPSQFSSSDYTDGDMSGSLAGLPTSTQHSPLSQPVNDRNRTFSPQPSKSDYSIAHHVPSTRLQHNLSPLDVSADVGKHHGSNSPLSAHSSSSQSSLGLLSRHTPSSGYTSGTSSTYSSLGKGQAGSAAPLVAAAGANLLRDYPQTSLSSRADSPLSSYRRPNSALSVHSYNSSRPASPGTRVHDMDGNDTGAVYSNMSSDRERRSSHDNVVSNKSSTDSGFHATTAAAKLSVTGTSTLQPAEVSRSPTPKLSRVRSRSSAGSTPSGMVRAKTEAWMNQAQQAASPASNRSSQHFGSSQNLIVNRSINALGSSGHYSAIERAPLKTPSSMFGSSKGVNASTEMESKYAQLEAEPNRSSSSIFRHGRQRSNTVGEAVSFPAVNVDGSLVSSQKSGAVPDGHCHKCLEKVIESGIRLQNGDRFHIGCFLCHGCKQVFTESEFHVVYGRPYHPACVPSAGMLPTSGTVTKCQKCHKVIGNKSIRSGGLNYHPQCFTCTHCNKVLLSTSRFFEVDGQIECEPCCEELDRERLGAPKVVPVARAADHFPVPPMAIPAPAGKASLEPSRPGGLASSTVFHSMADGYGTPLNASGRSSPVSLRSPGSPSSTATGGDGDMTSPVLMMASPLAMRSDPPALSSLFSTRTRPLPRFGGVTSCPRCQQPVSVMDQVPGPKNEKWHKKCLSCKECKKPLDSSALTRGEGEAFCRGCFVSKPFSHWKVVTSDISDFEY